VITIIIRIRDTGCYSDIVGLHGAQKRHNPTPRGDDWHILGWGGDTSWNLGRQRQMSFGGVGKLPFGSGVVAAGRPVAVGDGTS
jgi:hypothetical protein